MSEAIRLERAGGIATITFDRAAKMNAIDTSMTLRLTQIFKDLAIDGETRIVVLRGEGAHFSSGGDMSDISAMVSPDTATRVATVSGSVATLSKPLALAFEAVPQPVIASVRGHAIGVALQLVIMADLVVASETARFTLPQLRLGHTPDHGESWGLPRKIGLARALQMSLLAERIDAATAERYGLVNWLVADRELEARTSEIAGRIAASPPVAAQGAKALFHAGLGRSLTASMDAEIAMIEKVAAQEDFVEAITAFGERREPVFRGR